MGASSERTSSYTAARVGTDNIVKRDMDIISQIHWKELQYLLQFLFVSMQQHNIV